MFIVHRGDVGMATKAPVPITPPANANRHVFARGGNELVSASLAADP